MASGDLDQNFVKALKLLLSRSKESTDQLKQMLDEGLEQRKKDITIKSLGNGEESLSSCLTGKSGNRKDLEMVRKREREAERLSLEKLKHEISSLLDEGLPAKKPRLDLGSSPVVSANASPRSTDGKDKDRTKLKSDSKDKPREKLREIEEDIFFGVPSSSLTSNKQKDVDKSDKEDRQKDRLKDHDAREERSSQAMMIDSDSDTEISGDDQQKDSLEDMQFELDLGNLSCVVCKLIGVTSTNRLIECQECHSLYHQECHKPVVTENVNDPRFVWYCSKCAKNLKKIATKTTNKKAKTPLSGNARDSPVGKLASKADASLMPQPFKRLEQPIKPSAARDNGNGSLSSGNGRGLTGLASLAANLSKSSSSLDTGRSSSSSSLSTKSDSSSRLNQLGTVGHSAFTPRADVAKLHSEIASKLISSRGESVFKSSHAAVKGDSAKLSNVTAAGLQSKMVSSKPAISPAVSSSGGSTKMSQSSLMNADKRLQMMKKQAAKLAEKRSTMK